MDYRKMLEVLAKYLSRTNAQVALDRALVRSGLIASSVDDTTLPRLLPHLERTTQLFIDEHHMRQLRAALTRLAAPRASAGPVRVAVSNEAHVSDARLLARQLCEALSASALTTQKVATIVSELARNIVEYTPGGYVEMMPHEGRSGWSIRVHAVDTGPGIANLQQILAGEYKSRTGLGVGLVGTRRLSDRFDIDTSPSGTRVALEVNL